MNTRYRIPWSLVIPRALAMALLISAWVWLVWLMVRYL